MRHPVQLSTYSNAWYQPGRPLGWQMAWFFLGLPLLRSAFLPGSGIRAWLLRLFGATLGEGVVIKPGVRVKYPWQLHIGSHSWIGEDCWIDNLAPVHIGSDACLSQGSYLCTGNHDWSDPSFGLLPKSIGIKDGAWVGARTTVCPGVTLHECAVLAAGSVASRDIPPYEIHAGNPARFIRQRVMKSSAGTTEPWALAVGK